MAAKFAIKSLDHLVLTVRSIPASIAFYTGHLGMKHEVFTSPSSPDIQRHALLFGSQKINLHQSGKEFVPKAQTVMPGSADLCFLTESRVEDVLSAFREAKIEVLEGGKVVERTGAVGMIRSVYVRDPDGNLIEVSNYC
ncbi:VOC family protein [Aspergillus ibericus CBS 121593]|uniref:Glyoxalase/Bleomycin resistance protein/Dihydroxybiphenyl dioxygenase n=1 Tax=Aspergillus ibericus CBS 121593 TaxID=1448316 RepID=A0A395GKD9_9EURO|nr:Glyoxalase/Bleomycin resistance protein/Dihydroxybiphenyl dioxygenase [Aspergillus ibericus CBS 121593]RAK95267.1 Glyoxalase/Bleomycin resistance protein/Dihydroxybiphenyl dioxygenase [Aspergillus ibericus CBS 121593]